MLVFRPNLTLDIYIMFMCRTSHACGLWKLIFPGRAWISGPQRGRWSWGTEGSLGSPRRCRSSWPNWWEGKFILARWTFKTLILFFSQILLWAIRPVFCIFSHVWLRMIVQQGLTRKIVFWVVLSQTVTDFSLLVLLNKRGECIQSPNCLYCYIFLCKLLTIPLSLLCRNFIVL